MSSFGERLKKRREEKGLSLRQMEVATGITNSNLSKIERNKISPSIDAAVLISEYLDESLDYLAKGLVKYNEIDSEQAKLLEVYDSLDDNNRYALKTYASFLLSSSHHNVLGQDVLGQALSRKTIVDPEVGSVREERSVYLPLLGTAAAGMPILSDEFLEGFVPVPTDRIKKNNYLVKVKGESMIEAGIMDGDLVIINPQPVVENGEIALAKVDNEVTIKRFYQHGQEVRLKPANQSMTDIIVRNLDELKILGKVIGRIPGQEAKNNMRFDFNGA